MQWCREDSEGRGDGDAAASDDAPSVDAATERAANESVSIAEQFGEILLRQGIVEVSVKPATQELFKDAWKCLSKWNQG